MNSLKFSRPACRERAEPFLLDDIHGQPELLKSGKTVVTQSKTKKKAVSVSDQSDWQFAPFIEQPSTDSVLWHRPRYGGH